MAPLDLLTADDLRAVMGGYAGALRAHREAINRLNVYPVPDGDTGTNMALTLESVVAELDGAPPDMAGTCKAISHGSLMGARGNSGVILSQILRGIAEAFRDADDGDGVLLAAALAAASEAAYGAVMRPVEGTILTVVREASVAATEAAGRRAPLVEVLDGARVAGGRALERTPELLPVLAEAGVVDAGGAGFLLFLDAALHVVDGRPVPEPTADEGMLPGSTVRSIVAAGTAGHRDDHAHGGGAHGGGAHGGGAHGGGAHGGQGHGGVGEGGDVSDLRYEVMYFLEAPDEAIPGFKDLWATIGDSIVVVGGDGLFNCHIHTDDIGAAVEAGIEAGRPRNIRITDLLDQVEEEAWVRDAEPLPPEPSAASEPVPCAVVAVATGDGIRRIFYSLGVQGIVTGGQTMNPSTAQLLEAVERAPADEVVILPNNKNIIPVAEQVDGHTAKTVRVVPTRSVTEGFASLLSYDPQATSEANAEAMADAADHVTPAEVTRAVRDSACDLGPIREGDFMGLARDTIVALAPTLEEACERLLERTVTDEHEIVTIIEGEGATAAVTRHIEVWIHDHRPGASTEVHHGGQPLYPYLFGVE